MESKPENSTKETQPRDLDQLEKMLEIIDMEIVREGEKISQVKLEELTRKKGIIAKQIAILKGEPIDEGLSNN